MSVKRIRRKKVVEEAADAILKLIADEELIPGDELPSQAEIEQQLGISRSSIREAVSRFVSLGIIDVTRGKRMTVGLAGNLVLAKDLNELETSIRRKALIELIEIRSILEPEVTAIAAQRADDIHLVELDRIIEKMQTATDPESAMIQNFAFHRVLVQASGNSMACKLLQWLEDVSTDLYRDLYSKLYVQNPSRNEAEQHLPILNAFKAQDVDSIRILMKTHIQGSLVNEVLAAYGQSNFMKDVSRMNE